MRHLKAGRKLNRSCSHRKAMLNNLAVSILKHKKVETTTAKAKDVRKIVERLISLGKRNSVHSRRLAFKTIKDRNVIKNLFDGISLNNKTRNGGYTRLVKCGYRKGDCASMSIIQIIEQ